MLRFMSFGAAISVAALPFTEAAKSDAKDQPALLSTETVSEYSLPASKVPVKSSQAVPFLTLQKMLFKEMASMLPSGSGATDIPLVEGVAPAAGAVTPVTATEAISPPAACAAVGSMPASISMVSSMLIILLVLRFIKAPHF